MKVNATKTKVVRPTKSNFLGFTFFKTGEKWQCKPGDDRKKKLYEKLKLVLCRRKAVAMPLSLIFTKVNQIVRGWINYFRIGSIKVFLFKFGQWMRHKNTGNHYQTMEITKKNIHQSNENKQGI